MNFSKYNTEIFNQKNLDVYVKHFQDYINEKQKELDEFITRGKERILEVSKMEDNNEYVILGRTYKDGRNKSILLIIRYADGTQRDERYSFEKIADLRKKMIELKEKHKNVDWSEFEEEIK